MRYQAPEIMELAQAIAAIQSPKDMIGFDNQDASPAYADWE
jgi:hypothetical protein